MHDSVLAALKAAVDTEPENAHLRLHYAQGLSAAGKHVEALAEATKVLASHPDNREALKVAAETADASGDKIRATGYRNLLEALSWNTAKSMVEDAVQDIAQNIPDPFTDDFDEYGEEPQRLRASGDEHEDRPMWEADRPEITLKDVAGMENVKKRLHTSFLGPLRNPDLRKLYGKSLKGGLMLYGPPGCGKTFIARAVAGELGAKFLSIGLTEVLDMWLGNSEKNLHEFFELARRNTPCVLFMDELDAIGRKRSLMRHNASSTLINTLLSEMDGVQYSNDGVYILAATNHPWDVDTALRRPGRLDRMLLVLPPDEGARQAIIEGSLKNRPHKDIDVKWLASKSEDFSGADVAHLCDTAAENALEASIESGVARPITMNDFKSALREIRPSTRPWFETAKNHAIFANEGGVYDDLVEYLKRKRWL